MIHKTSIRFFENVPVRAVWDEETSKWWFCAMDIVEALTESKNPRNYWVKFKKRHDELVTICHQLKLKAKDGKFYNTDVVDDRGLNTVKNERRGHVGPFVTLCWSPIITERPAAVPCNGRFC